jgi:uncharacterized protein involved in copper resistance
MKFVVVQKGDNCMSQSSVKELGGRFKGGENSNVDDKSSWWSSTIQMLWLRSRSVSLSGAIKGSSMTNLHLKRASVVQTFDARMA